VALGFAIPHVDEVILAFIVIKRVTRRWNNEEGLEKT
jgi:hypothetical protein